MIAAQRHQDTPALDAHEANASRRLEALRVAGSRRARLERLFSDPAYLEKVMDDGRYVRLCFAIAWASEREERARLAVEIDAMVVELRQAKRN